MEVFVLLKGYDYEGYGSDVEVFSTLEEAEERKYQHMNGGITGSYGHDNVVIDYGYDMIKIVKRTI
jgi:hypothetical protein